jgi:MFS family permease
VLLWVVWQSGVSWQVFSLKSSDASGHSCLHSVSTPYDLIVDAFVNKSTALNVAGIFAQYFALGSRPLFLVGKILTGLPLGFYQALSPAYTSEVLPLRLRGAATSATVLAIVLGQFMAFVAIRIVTTIPGSTAYQHVFAVQWGFSGVGLAFLYFVPESPYFLVARGRIDKATKSILKLYGKNADVQSRLADIKASLDQVTGGTEEATGLMACFHKEHRKRTILALCMFFIQTQSGTAWVLSYIGYFLQLGGKTPLAANNISLIVIAMTLIGNVLGWPLIDKLGRRAVIVYGTSVQLV